MLQETEEYFEAKDKSFYQKGIKLLEKSWNQCITLEGDYVDESSWILPKSCCFISQAWDLLSDVLYIYWPPKPYAGIILVSDN